MSVYYLSAKFSVLSACLVFNESFKSRTAAGGGYIHFLYFTCAMEREKERRGLGGWRGAWRMWGLQGCCNECTAVKKNSVSLPGREGNKGGGGGEGDVGGDVGK